MFASITYQRGSLRPTAVDLLRKKALGGIVTTKVGKSSYKTLAKIQSCDLQDISVEVADINASKSGVLRLSAY